MVMPLWEHLPEIAARIARAAHLLVLLDYDGTLTPIVARPEDAALEPNTREALAALAQRPRRTVAILSGRALSDVRARIGIEELIYAGNHGFEIEGPGIAFTCPEAAALTGKLRALAGNLEQRFRSIPGLVVEDKSLTLSIHYRLVPEEEMPRCRDALATAFGDLSSCFQVTTGHKVYEIRPRLNWNKGKAATWIRAHIRIAGTLSIFVGDDRTDEDAFATLSDGITVKVGKAEMTVASYSVSDPGEVCRFLNWLAACDKG